MKGYCLILIGLLFTYPLYPMGIAIHYSLNGGSKGVVFEENLTLASVDFPDTMEFSSEDILFEAYPHPGQDTLYVLTTQMGKDMFVVFFQTIETYLPRDVESFINVVEPFINDILIIPDDGNTGKVQITSEKKEDVWFCLGELEKLMSDNREPVCGEN